MNLIKCGDPRCDCYAWPAGNPEAVTEADRGVSVLALLVLGWIGGMATFGLIWWRWG